MKLRDTLLHEWQTKLSRPATLLAIAAFALFLIFAAVNGRVARDTRTLGVEKHQAEVAAEMQAWIADVKALETKGDQSGVPPWSGSPMDATFASALPPAPLADFSIGQADLLPGTGTLSLWDPDIRLFSRYEFADPVSLSLGAFDLSKAIILLLPLLMMVLSFDALSADRDAGRLGAILAQGASVRSLLWHRLAIRCSLVVALALLLAGFAMVLNRGATSFAERLAPFSLWTTCVALYGALWFSIIAYIASRNLRGETILMRLLMAWTGLTLIVPAGVTSIAEAVYPPPSRLEYLALARKTEIDTERAEAGIAQQFFIDHPELVIEKQSEMPAYVRTAFFATSSVDDATRPLLREFDEAALRRDRALSLLRYLSPAIIAHGTFNEIAGSAAARHRRYLEQARAFKAAYSDQVAPHVVAGRRLPAAQAEALPRFQFKDVPLNAVAFRAMPALIFLALAACAFLLAAHGRIRKVDRASALGGGETHR